MLIKAGTSVKLVINPCLLIVHDDVKFEMELSHKLSHKNPNIINFVFNNILDYRKQIGFFNNIYELVHIENITIQDVHNFRHFIYI